MSFEIQGKKCKQKNQKSEFLIDVFSSVAQSCPTLWDPMNHSTPGLPVHHQLLEFTQTHVHWVGDAIQSSHPLSSPSPPALNLSQCQGLFKWVSSSHQVAKVLEFQLQHQSFQWTARSDLSEEASFFSTQLSLQSNSHIHTWPLETPYPWLDGPLLAK